MDPRGSKCQGFESTPHTLSGDILGSSSHPGCGTVVFTVSGVEYVSGLQGGGRVSWSLLFHGTLLFLSPSPRHWNCICCSWSCHWFLTPSKCLYKPAGTCIPSFNRGTMEKVSSFMLMYTVVWWIKLLHVLVICFVSFAFSIQNNLAAVCVGRQIWVNNERLWGMTAPIW